jgi:hypothetical protein
LKYNITNNLNTYACTKATIISSKKNGIWIIILKIFFFEINPRIKCPVVKFVPKRTIRVIGRIICLTNSINTIKDIKTTGVEVGVKWIIISFKKKLIFNNIIPPQNITDNGIVIENIEFNEKICEYKLKKFVKKIKLKEKIIIFF